MASALETLLTPDEVAERLRLARSTVYRLISSGVMPSVRVSPGAIRVEAVELAEWIGERRTSSAVGDSSANAVGRSSVDDPAERDGTSSSREAVEPAQLAGER